MARIRLEAEIGENGEVIPPTPAPAHVGDTLDWVEEAKRQMAEKNKKREEKAKQILAKKAKEKEDAEKAEAERKRLEAEAKRKAEEEKQKAMKKAFIGKVKMYGNKTIPDEKVFDAILFVANAYLTYTHRLTSIRKICDSAGYKLNPKLVDFGWCYVNVNINPMFDSKITRDDIKMFLTPISKQLAVQFYNTTNPSHVDIGWNDDNGVEVRKLPVQVVAIKTDGSVKKGSKGFVYPLPRYEFSNSYMIPVVWPEGSAKAKKSLTSLEGRLPSNNGEVADMQWYNMCHEINKPEKI